MMKFSHSLFIYLLLVDMVRIELTLTIMSLLVRIFILIETSGTQSCNVVYYCYTTSLAITGTLVEEV